MKSCEIIWLKHRVSNTLAMSLCQSCLQRPLLRPSSLFSSSAPTPSDQGLISGKIDQQGAIFRVKSIIGRDPRPHQLLDIVDKMTSWCVETVMSLRILSYWMCGQSKLGKHVIPYPVTPSPTCCNSLFKLSAYDALIIRSHCRLFIFVWNNILVNILQQVGNQPDPIFPLYSQSLYISHPSSSHRPFCLAQLVPASHTLNLFLNFTFSVSFSASVFYLIISNHLLLPYPL